MKTAIVLVAAVSVVTTHGASLKGADMPVCALWGGQCGPDIGYCPKGQFCSPSGLCGSGPDFETNAQQEYSNVQVCGGPCASPGGKCGPENGNLKCPRGQFCSAWGSCGVSMDHFVNGLPDFSNAFECDIAYGAKPLQICAGHGGKCGPKNDGKICQLGEYCSEYGWCGRTSEYEYDPYKSFSNNPMCGGRCTTNQQCGPKANDMECARGVFCSTSGWCGKTKEYFAPNSPSKYSNSNCW